MINKAELAYNLVKAATQFYGISPTEFVRRRDELDLNANADAIKAIAASLTTADGNLD